MIELYAVVDDPGPPLPDALRTVSADGLALVCAPAQEAEPTPERLWEHERMIEGLMDGRDLLPVRYGTRVADEAAAARALRDRHAELAGALDRVRGAVELSVRALGGVAPDEAQSGTEYLRGKAQAMNSLHEPLDRLARASMQRPASGDLLRAAYLVERGAVEAFVARVAELDAAHPELRLLCTGPWPPYSFSRA